MDVLTSETCWALNNEIIKQMTSSWSVFIQQMSYLQQHKFYVPLKVACRSKWPCVLRCRSEAARLLEIVGSNPTGVMDVALLWRVLCFQIERCLCDELITCPEESYRMWYVIVCEPETSRMRRPWPTGGCCAKKKLHTAVINKVVKKKCTRNLKAKFTF